MKTVLSLLLAAGMLSAACIANAYPTLAGPTGYGVLPTATTVYDGQLVVAGDYVAAKDFDYPPNGDGGFSSNFHMQDKGGVPLRALFGLTDGLEIGAGYDFHDATPYGEETDSANRWSVNAKYVLPFHFIGASWGVGGQYARTRLDGIPPDSDTVNDTQFYFAGTGTVFGGNASGLHLNVTGGINWTRQSSDVLGLNNNFRFYGGAQLFITHDLSVAGDVQTKRETMDTADLYSVVGRYQLGKMLGVEAGWSNADYTLINGGPTGRFFAGAEISFGGKYPTHTGTGSAETGPVGD